MNEETSGFSGLASERLERQLYGGEAGRQFFAGGVYGAEEFVPRYDGGAYGYGGSPGYPEVARGTVVYAPEEDTQEYEIIAEPDGNSDFEEEFLVSGEVDETDFVVQPQKANGFFVACSIMLGACLLAVSGYFGWDWYQSRGQGQVIPRVEHAAVEEHPKYIGAQVVEPIFAALKDGDGDALAERWIDAQDLTEQERSLMHTANYKNVEKRISSYKIRDEVEYIDGDTGRVAVEVVQDGVRKNVGLTVKKTGVDYGFYPVWQVDGFSLISPVDVAVDMEVPSVVVNSVTVPLTVAEGKAGTSLRLLPGSYSVSVPDDAPVSVSINGRGSAKVGRLYSSKGGAEVFKSLGDESDGEVKLKMVPSSYAKDEVRSQVEQYLYACAEATVSDNTGCPFTYSNFEVSDDVARNFSYEIVRQPVVDTIQVLNAADRRYVDAAGSFRWARVKSSSAGKIRKSWEYNIGTARRALWQSRESVQDFAVSLDVVINGDRIAVVPRK